MKRRSGGVNRGPTKRTKHSCLSKQTVEHSDLDAPSSDPAGQFSSLPPSDPPSQQSSLPPSKAPIELSSDDEDTTKETAIEKICKQVKNHKGSTSALKCHAIKCWGQEAVIAVQGSENLTKARTAIAKHGKKAQSMLVLALRSVKGWFQSFSTRPPDTSSIRIVTARWIAEAHRPFRIVANRCYCWLQKEARPDRYVPSRETVARDIMKLYGGTRAKLGQELQDYPGLLPIAIDTWTSPNHHAFMSVITSWPRKQADGKEDLFTTLLDFVELLVSHSGENMASAVAEILKSYGIEDKLLSITCDNASANTAMLAELPKLLPNFPGLKAHVRCFAHTINLTAKGILKPFEVCKGTADGDGVPDKVSLEELQAKLMDIREGNTDHDNEDGFAEVLNTMSNTERQEWGDAVKPIHSALYKCRKIAFKIINSSTLLLPQWRALLPDILILPRDVSTRWNSTYDMLNAFQSMRPQVTQFVGSNSNGLAEFQVGEEEWESINGLTAALKLLKDATIWFSGNSPTVAQVIPAMDAIDEALATGMVDSEEVSDPIKHALAIGKRTINKYYALSDDSNIYRMAMVLHPQHKLHYFEQAHWDQAWIDESIDITRAAYTPFKPPDDHATSMAQSPPSLSSSPPTNSFISLMSKQSQLASFASDRDELDRYLMDSCVPTENPLHWWLMNRKVYPNLAKLAVSVHTIPATSVAVERSFSQGRILISHLRNRLRPTTIQALMCFGAWSRQDFITNEELLIILHSTVADDPDIGLDWLDDF
ncbi:hypothetical protein D9757_015275 [Collybiopsis confluens]|uniref:HAT C-terminal dimerisation domain-containing protein n=1 Tax=Collybiopsis confluens TaxID=2823264 RepID=A0A8H5LPL0_9AGAR|nr:hypothetical protein D9757_015275 [Collybiopsis confluens]